jgi:hypothetical protein
MSKKKKRQVRRSPQTIDQNRKSVSTQSYRDDFNPDYSYVSKDLRRIGILAGTFLSILVILAFFLR